MNRTMHRPLWAALLTLGLGLLAGTAHAQTTPNTGTGTTRPGTTTPGNANPGTTPGTADQPGYPASPGRMGTDNGTSTSRRRGSLNGTTPGSSDNSRRDRRSRTNKTNKTNNSNSNNSSSPTGM